MQEILLAAAIVNWLTMQHWDVYQEVKFRNHGGIADIAAVRDGKLWVIECKTALTFTVLEQAAQWHSHYRSVAVPATQRYSGRQTAYVFAKNYLKVGVLEFEHQHNYIREIMIAPVMREHHEFSKALIGQLKDGHKTHAVAGSNREKRYTPYVETIERVKRFITNNPGCTLAAIMDHLGDNHHYANSTSMRGSLRTALKSWEREWCEIREDDKGTPRYFANRPSRS